MWLVRLARRELTVYGAVYGGGVPKVWRWRATRLLVLPLLVLVVKVAASGSYVTPAVVRVKVPAVVSVQVKAPAVVRRG